MIKNTLIKHIVIRNCFGFFGKHSSINPISFNSLMYVVNNRWIQNSSNSIPRSNKGESNEILPEMRLEKHSFENFVFK